EAIAKHKVAGSTRSRVPNELGLRRGGQLVKDEELRWGSKDPFPASGASRHRRSREGGVPACRTWQTESKIGGDASRAGGPRPGRSSPGGGVHGESGESRESGESFFSRCVLRRNTRGGRLLLRCRRWRARGDGGRTQRRDVRHLLRPAS